MTKEEKQKEKRDRLAQALRKNLRRRKQYSVPCGDKKTPDKEVGGKKE